MVRAILIFGIVAALVILTIENAVTVLPLVVLGQTLPALPLSVWILGAIAAGSATTLLFAGLVQLGRSRRSDAYAPNVSYGFRTPFEPRPPTDRARQRASAAASQEVWDDSQWSSSREPVDRQPRRTSDGNAAASENRSYRSTYQPSEPTARSTPSSDDWENRRPLNLDSWEDWGLPGRSASAPPNRTSQTPFNPPPYRPPAQTYPASTPYVPPVVDAEVVTPRRPAESEDDSDEDYYLDEDFNEDEYQTGGFSQANAADRYGENLQNEEPEVYEQDYHEEPYQTGYRDDPPPYQNEVYQDDDVDERQEADEPEWRDYGRDTYTSSQYADDYTEPDGYDEEDRYDDDPDDYATSFPLYREPGTEFQWPVQPEEDDRPDERESKEDVWESWEDSETYRAGDASSYSVNEPPSSADTEPSDPDLDIWDEWDEASDGDRPPPPENRSTPAPSSSEPRVIITEVQGTPVVQKQTGTLYSYSYRRPEDSMNPVDSSDEADIDAGDRVLITPPAPEPDDDTKAED